MNIRSLSMLVALLIALSQPAFAGGFFKPKSESAPVTTSEDKPSAEVPEPGSFFLLAAGIAAFAFTRRKK